MKRKRYIKLLMGRGFSKREAIELADNVVNEKSTYADAWGYFYYDELGSYVIY